PSSNQRIDRGIGALEPLNGGKLINRHTQGGAAALQHAQISRLGKNLGWRRAAAGQGIGLNAVIGVNRKNIVRSRRDIGPKDHLRNGIAVWLVKPGTAAWQVLTTEQDRLGTVGHII